MQNSAQIVKRVSMYLAAMLSLCLHVQSQDLSVYRKFVFRSGADSMPYRLCLPENYDPSKHYPVLFFLHGSGERGSDNEAQLVHGARWLISEENRRHYPMILVFPQCSAMGYWANTDRRKDSLGKLSFTFFKGGKPTRDMALLQQLVRHIMRTYPVKMDAIYAGGLSMGGMGTYELVRRMPRTFRAAFAICGGADPATARKLKHTRWWIFHGEKDDVVDPAFSKKMAEALRRQGAELRVSWYPGANHNSWDSAFAENELLPWLVSGVR